MENVDFDDLKRECKTKEIRNTHINIGTGSDQTIRELAMMIKEIVGFKGEIKWDHSKPDGTPRKLLDVGKLRNLGMIIEIKLQESTKRIWEVYLRG